MDKMKIYLRKNGKGYTLGTKDGRISSEHESREAAEKWFDHVNKLQKSRVLVDET